MNFNHIKFERPDPFGDGLGDAIAAEQSEPEAKDFLQPPTGEELSDYLQNLIATNEFTYDEPSFSED